MVVQEINIADKRRRLEDRLYLWKALKECPDPDFYMTSLERWVRCCIALKHIDELAALGVQTLSPDLEPSPVGTKQSRVDHEKLETQHYWENG